MSIAELLKKVPTIGTDMLRFFLTPRHFSIQVGENLDLHASKKEVLGWSLAFSAFVFSVYPLLSGHSLGDPFSKARDSPPLTRPAPKPSFHEFQMVFGIGIGVNFPLGSKIPLDHPQPVIFRFGPGVLLVDHVVPSAIATKTASTLLLTIAIYSFLYCLYPAALICNAEDSSAALWFAGSTTLWFANFAFSAIWVLGTIVILLETILLRDLLDIRPLEISPGWGAFIGAMGVIPFISVCIRAVWSCFRAIFAFTRWRFLVSIFVAWILSYLLAPIALCAAFLVIKFQSWLEVIL